MRPLESHYEATRGRIVELVHGLDATADEIAVPACPGWSVKNVVSHLTGNCADVLTGNLAGIATPEWTAAQIDARHDWKLGDVLAEWDDVGPKFASMLDDFPGEYGRQSLGDLIVHEHDLRGALDRPGERETEPVGIAIEVVTRFVAGTGALVLGLGPLEVRAGETNWTLGTGERIEGDNESWRDAIGSGAPPPQATSPPIATVTTTAFEWFRAITGRRSPRQISSFDWSVDPKPFLPLFGYGPFVIRNTDLQE